jgi:uncharacterized protein (DUF2141 family)
VTRFVATIVIAFASAISGANAAQTAMAARLRVTVDRIIPAGGNLIVGLYDEATFPLAPGMPLFSRTIANVQGTATAVFDRLPPGTYAVKVLQDLNRDGRAEAGEPTAVSNGGAPENFDAAAIVLHPGENSIAIHLH